MKKSVNNRLFLILILTGTIFFAVIPRLFSNETAKERPKKDTILIYNFQTFDNTEKHQYYSFIIPQTVTRNLQRAGKYRVFREKQKLQLPPGIDEQRQALHSIGKEKKADFIITGECSIRNKILEVKLQIFNVRGKSSKELISESREVGVLLRDTIDRMSGDIQEEVAAFQNENRLRFDRSSTYGFFRTIEGLTVGFEGGKFFIFGFWSEELESKYYIRPFIFLPFSDYFGMSLNMDYLSSNNDESDSSIGRDFSMYAPTIDAHLTIPVASFFNVSFAVGWGAAFTRVRVYSSMGGPLNDPDFTTRTTTAYVTSSMALEFIFGPLYLKTGTSYKRAFIFLDHLQLITVFMGIGYRF